jgi:hypothetical protein
MEDKGQNESWISKSETAYAQGMQLQQRLYMTGI